ncbi:hypothetical protein CFO_g1736 [Ceratocystis platani]|uniref:Uncharacterized protein n=1 Tax=Ceratocystis fimbriata f. sp. platani TaxID=88771 RepID=A0A0F8B318_CERFI|nr:hypothetical protein CFO_g1736 [Ceratocystis platani]
MEAHMGTAPASGVGYSAVDGLCLKAPKSAMLAVSRAEQTHTKTSQHQRTAHINDRDYDDDLGMGDTVQSCTDYSDNEYEHEVAGYTDDESDYDYDKGQLSPSVTQALEMDIDEIIARSYRNRHAIWDLGETVRYTNIPSASLIYDILDSLSDDLNVLSMEMNKFFARVDSDIDGILIILQWARRELHSVHQLPWNPVAYMLDNFYLTFAGSGIFEQPDGQQTKLGTLTTAIIGRTQSQRARHALERTFLEFLGVMESVVTDELERSLPLLARFDAADSKFQLLAETVQRDDANADDALERRSALATLWTRLLGPRATAVQKYARNKELLRDVRTKTQSNKYILVDHNAKLAALKAALDGIRKTLVSPLIRTVNSTSLTLADQIKGLDEVSSHLSSLRQDQRKRLLQLLYGTLEPRLTIDDREEEGQVKGAGKS